MLTGFTAPNPQQAIVGETDLDAQVVILEAETGSGKTEVFMRVSIHQVARSYGASLLHKALPAPVGAQTPGAQPAAAIMNAPRKMK